MGKEARAPRLRRAAGALAFVSQGIHLWVLPGQLAAAMLPGVFFFWVAICQGLLGAGLLLGGGRWTARLGILFNVFVVLVWLLTHAVSFPPLFEPVRLPVEGLGAIATIVEVALTISLVMLHGSTPRRKKGRSRR